MKYAVVLTHQNLPVIGSFIANVMRPYAIPEGQENDVRNKLSEKFPKGMVGVADKETLISNPFDLYEEDFEKPIEVI